ncbi:MAG: D-alanyl-D-alanine carboxypeptidase [Fimbriimonadaceae bacterium]|nr:D-alanyl-D-alanine carboxypeptidase [Fimbriimonadaceae bacterium]
MAIVLGALACSSTLLAQTPPPPVLTAQSVIMVDWQTGQVLYEKNADTRRYPASTTKIMTALLTIENLGTGTLLTAPAGIDRVTGSSMHLKPGEQLTVETLLYGLMLRSANDGAEMLATKIGGSLPGFARMMNAKAVALGCRGTRFVTPHGLPNESHYTTARDMSKIASAAMHYPIFAEIVRKPDATILRSINLQDTFLESTNSLLTEDSRVVGIKTGWTNAAGRCFVGATNQHDTTIITVIFKSEKWQDDQRSLMSWVDENYSRRSIVAEGETVGTIPLHGGWDHEVKVTVPPDQMFFAANNEEPMPIISTELSASAPIRKGEQLAEIDVRLPSGELVRVPLVATEDQDSKPLWAVMGTSPWTGGVLLAGIGLFAITKRKPARRRLSHRNLRQSNRGMRSVSRINRF